MTLPSLLLLLIVSVIGPTISSEVSVSTTSASVLSSWTTRHYRHDPRILQPFDSEERPSFSDVPTHEEDNHDAKKKKNDDFLTASLSSSSAHHPSSLSSLTTAKDNNSGAVKDETIATEIDETAAASSPTTTRSSTTDHFNHKEHVGFDHRDPARHGHDEDPTTLSSSTISSVTGNAATASTATTEGDWKAGTIDVVIALFFALAAIWLILAVIYSTVLLVLLRLQANGDLDLYDENLGLLVLFGGRVKLRFGWLLRRYAMQLENDHNRRLHRRQQEELARAPAAAVGDVENSGDVNISDMNNEDFVSPRSIRIMTREERREAMEEILTGKRHQREKESTNKQDNISDQDDRRTEIMSESKSIPSCSEDDDDSDDIEKCASPRKETPRSGHSQKCKCSSPSAASCRSDQSDDEGPVCSICLGGYDPDTVVFKSKACPHMFHSTCIMDWLERRNHTCCPCCRETMVSDDQVWEIVQRNRRERRRKSRRTNILTNTLIRWLGSSIQREEERTRSISERYE